MSVRCACPHCRAAVTTPDEAAGKTVRCPKCRQPFAAPEGPPAVAAVEELPNGGTGEKSRRGRKPADSPPPTSLALGAGIVARILWALYIPAAGLVGFVGLVEVRAQPGAVQQATVASLYAFYQLTGYCLMRAVGKILS